MCSPVHRGRPSSARAVRWCHLRRWSAVAGWSSCAETACWLSTSLSQSPVALWVDSALNGMTQGKRDTRPFFPVSSLFLNDSYSIPAAIVDYTKIYIQFQLLSPLVSPRLKLCSRCFWSNHHRTIMKGKFVQFILNIKSMHNVCVNTVLKHNTHFISG